MSPLMPRRRVLSRVIVRQLATGPFATECRRIADDFARPPQYAVCIESSDTAKHADNETISGLQSGGTGPEL